MNKTFVDVYVVGSALLILLLIILLTLSFTVWRSERVVFIDGPTTTVTNPADQTLIAENTALKGALAQANVDLNKTRADLNKSNDDLSRARAALSQANADLDKTRINPGLIPKSWTSFTGDEAMRLALTTFGNIRIKIWFSEGSVPLLSEAITLVAQKPKDLTLSAWIGGTEQARNWPIGLASPNAGDWPTEVFLAKDADGTVKYFYIVPLTSNVVLVDRAWVVQNNLYWLFVATPAYRK